MSNMAARWLGTRPEPRLPRWRDITKRRSLTIGGVSQLVLPRQQGYLAFVTADRVSAPKPACCLDKDMALTNLNHAFRMDGKERGLTETGQLQRSA